MKLQPLLRNIFGLLLGAFFLYLSLRHVPMPEVLSSIRASGIPLFLLGTLALLSAAVLRAYRWTLILNRQEKPAFANAFSSIMIGDFFNAALPARTGDILRSYHFSRISGTRLMSVLSTVAVERIFDTLLLLLLLLFSVFSLRFHDSVTRALTLVLLFCIVSIATLLFTYRFSQYIASLLARIPVARLASVLSSWFQEYISALQRVASIKQVSSIFLLTLITWSQIVLSSFLLLNASPLPPALVTVPSAVFVTALISLALFIPSTPSSIGVFNYAVILALTIQLQETGAAAAEAYKPQTVAASFLMLAAAMLPDLTVGTFYFFRERNRFSGKLLDLLSRSRTEKTLLQDTPNNGPTQVP